MRARHVSSSGGSHLTPRFNVWSGITRDRLTSYLFLFPTAALLAALIAYPVLITFQLSFHDIDISQIRQPVRSPWTLALYRRVLGSSDFWHAVRVSAIYTIGAALIGFFLGLGLALLLHREFRFRRLARILVLLPWPVPSAIAGLIFIWFFDQNFGVLNHVLSSLGLVRTPVPWLNSANYALAALIATTVWKTYPFYTLMMLAGLQSIPQELYEAGDIDGASLLQRFWYITLPALRTVMAIALVLQILWSFGHVDIIKVMTNGGPSRGTETLSMFIYKEAFQFFDFGQAAVAGMMGLVISVLVVSVILPVVSKEFF